MTLQLTEEILRELTQLEYTQGRTAVWQSMLSGPRYAPTTISDCGRCGRPTVSAATLDHGRHTVCADCLSMYNTCRMCGQRSGTLQNLTDHRDYVARSACCHCRERLFWACPCGYWHRHGTAGNCPLSSDRNDSGPRDDDSCCVSPAKTFTLRNDGEEPVSNDTPFTVTLPGGEISAEGIVAIRRYLYAQRQYSAYDIVPTMDPAWVAQGVGGTFTRRLSRALYQDSKQKIPDNVLSQIGNIARDHTPEARAYDLEVTREFNLSAAAFAHGGSCYWNGYAYSRCTLKTNGAFAIRSFSVETPTRPTASGPAECDCSDACRAETARRAATSTEPEPAVRTVTGRVWVQPVRFARTLWHPTFDIEGADGFVVFNGYGDLSGYTPTRILAHMVGMTYRKIEYREGDAYINAGGYLVAPEGRTSTTPEIRLTAPHHANLFQVESQRKAATV
jgi:hypothetical protein